MKIEMRTETVTHARPMEVELTLCTRCGVRPAGIDTRAPWAEHVTGWDDTYLVIEVQSYKDRTVGYAGVEKSKGFMCPACTLAFAAFMGNP